jgi:MSHA biogenesis protein MshO
MRTPSPQHGFTLIELVITLVISTIVVAFVSLFISGPVQGFVDQARRVRLVDGADAALERIGRDIRRSLPNSVRTTSSPGGVTALEVLSTVDGARYRARPPGADNQVLDFATADVSFNTLGPFTQVVKPFISSSHYLAVYNVGVPGADAYELANVITPDGTTITIAADSVPGEDRVTLAPPSPFRFAYPSPTQRVFLVDGPITYLCDTTLGTLMRYEGYDIQASQAVVATHGGLLSVGATASLMATQVTGCSFGYTPGTAERAGLVSLQIVVSAQGETVSLLSQVHVDNVP